MPQPSRVMVDAVGIQGGGGREVALDVVRACVSEAGISGILLCSGDTELLGAFADRDSVRTLDLHHRGYAWRVAWWFGGAVKAAQRNRCSAILHLANIAIGPSQGLPRGVMVHQRNALIKPNRRWFFDLRSLRYRILRHLIAKSAEQSDLVFVQTEAVAEAVRSLASHSEVAVASPVTPSSLPPPSKAARSSATTHRRILYIGSDAPHKNVRLLRETTRCFRDEMSGGRFVLSLHSPAGPTPGLDYLGPLDRQQVADELERASALVMPSFEETAGLPMLEALQRGVPVLAADRPYARAICGNAALYFDPKDAASLAAVCKLIINDESQRQDLIEAGRVRLGEIEARRGDKAMASWLALAATAPPGTGRHGGS